MNITYLHGFSVRATFLDYFTFLFFAERISLGVNIADVVIRHHQTVPRPNLNHMLTFCDLIFTSA